MDIDRIMKRAFWDLVRTDLESSPPKYDQFITLVGEIRDRLVRIRPRYHKITEVLDTDYLTQRLTHQVADDEYLGSLVMFIGEQITMCCAPAYDELAKEWIDKCQTKLQSDDGLPVFFEWFVETTHAWIDTIEEGIREFVKKIELDNSKK